MTVPAQLSTTPTLDGRFILVEALGHGGQGRVFRAYDRLSGRDVAIKVLHDARATDPVHPLALEFSAWSRLRHPHVVRVYALMRAWSGPLAPGTPYLVLELVRGLPVHRALCAGRVAPLVLEELARRILRALDHIHGAGLVHRDLKPGNILVGPSRRGLGRVKLTDFGLASERGQAGEPGHISGSIPYVAPESIVGLAVDCRADLYGLGVLLFFLATGRLPLASKSPERWLRWHLAGPVADPRPLRPELSERFAELIARLTARPREARPESAAEALRFLGSAPTRPAPGSARTMPLGDRAGFRLALCAARAGAVRELTLPAHLVAARAARSELTTLAAAAGVTCLTLERTAGARLSNLARVVMALLLELGPAAHALVEKHRLQRALPLALLAGVPLWDRSGHDEHRARRPAAARVVAARVAAFFLEAANHRPLALVVDASALGDPLAAALVSHLRRLMHRAKRDRLESAGFLLAVPAK